jgi:hypothetical protein
MFNVEIRSSFNEPVPSCVRPMLTLICIYIVTYVLYSTSSFEDKKKLRYTSPSNNWNSYFCFYTYKDEIKDFQGFF